MAASASSHLEVLADGTDPVIQLGGVNSGPGQGENGRGRYRGWRYRRLGDMERDPSETTISRRRATRSEWALTTNLMIRCHPTHPRGDGPPP